jgi:voltage-gated potassium channel
MKSGSFVWLFLALLIFLIGTPVADDLVAVGRPVIRALAFSCLLGLGVLSLTGAGRLFNAAVVFAIAGIVMSFAAYRGETLVFVYGSFICIMGFLIIAIYYTFKRVATDDQISGDRIVGAIVVYLLLGVAWAVAYSIVELYWPGSFSGFMVGAGSEWDSEWLYFSFVTMTTLGYGDIAPISAIARVLAYMQAMFGQFYIAILVAGLVSAYISQKDAEQ